MGKGGKELTAGLDTEKTIEVVQILGKEAKENHKAVIMVTHDQDGRLLRPSLGDRRWAAKTITD